MANFIDGENFDLPNADIPPDSASDGLAFDEASDISHHSGNEDAGAPEKFKVKGKGHVQNNKDVVPKEVIKARSSVLSILGFALTHVPETKD
jgi:hypothetical protein